MPTAGLATGRLKSFMNDFHLPWGIGPHEGRECHLMLAGEKPMAMFCDVASHSDHFPEEEFAPHVAAGAIRRREELYSGANGGIITRCLFFSLPGQERRMEAAHMIQKEIFTGVRSGTEADDIRLGRLLGYTEKEIAAYLDHVRHYRTRI